MLRPLSMQQGNLPHPCLPNSNHKVVAQGGASAGTLLLHSIIATELPERDYADSVARLIKQLNGAPVIKLVEALGPFLTGDDDAQRARATAVLSEVSGGRPCSIAPRLAGGATTVGHR